MCFVVDLLCHVLRPWHELSASLSCSLVLAWEHELFTYRTYPCQAASFNWSVLKRVLMILPAYLVTSLMGRTLLAWWCQTSFVPHFWASCWAMPIREQNLEQSPGMSCTTRGTISAQLRWAVFFSRKVCQWYDLTAPMFLAIQYAKDKQCFRWSGCISSNLMWRQLCVREIQLYEHAMQVCLHFGELW